MASHNPKYDTAAHARARKRLVVTPIRRYGYSPRSGEPFGQ